MSTVGKNLALIRAATRVLFTLGLMVAFAVSSLVAKGGLQGIFFGVFLALALVELGLLVVLWRRTFAAAER